jgi:hypothetical protein
MLIMKRLAHHWDTWVGVKSGCRKKKVETKEVAKEEARSCKHSLRILIAARITNNPLTVHQNYSQETPKSSTKRPWICRHRCHSRVRNAGQCAQNQCKRSSVTRGAGFGFWNSCVQFTSYNVCYHQGHYLQNSITKAFAPYFVYIGTQGRQK